MKAVPDDDAMFPDDDEVSERLLKIDIESARISVEIVKLLRGESYTNITAALTTGLGVFIARGFSDPVRANAMADAVAVKLKKIIARQHKDMKH